MKNRKNQSCVYALYVENEMSDMDLYADLDKAIDVLFELWTDDDFYVNDYKVIRDFIHDSVEKTDYFISKEDVEHYYGYNYIITKYYVK